MAGKPRNISVSAFPKLALEVHTTVLDLYMDTEDQIQVLVSF